MGRQPRHHSIERQDQTSVRRGIPRAAGASRGGACMGRRDVAHLGSGGKLMWRIVRCSLVAVLVASQCVAAAKADDFPRRPITLMVGLAAGGITDVTARLYAEVVARNLGQRI